MIGIYLTLALLATAAAQSATSTSSAPEVTESTVSRTAFDIDTHIETEFYPQTCNGSAVKITGLSKDGMAIFLGIPFAEPRKSGSVRSDRSRRRPSLRAPRTGY